MRSTITARGQTVIPAPIRVVPVDPSPVKAFRGQGRCGGSADRLVAERRAERLAEGVAEA
jgi:hypothetical protein